MYTMLANSSQVLRESRTIQIIEPNRGTAGSPMLVANGILPGFLTKSGGTLPQIETS
jgi:hypothetical protein